MIKKIAIIRYNSNNFTISLSNNSLNTLLELGWNQNKDEN